MKETTNLEFDRHILLFDKSITIKEGKNVYLMKKEVIIVGRQSSVDIPLKYDFVSREHATLVQFKDQESNALKYQVVDGGKSGRSTNGLRLNGESILASELKHGDVVTIGKNINFVYININLSDLELYKYIDIISNQDRIDESTGAEISIVSEMFHSYSDTILKTKILN